MATFAKTSFNAAAYGSFRPTYPATIYNRVIKYHSRNGSSPPNIWNKVVDLGCGTGQATKVWVEHFDKVVGVDPSPGMLKQAREQFSGLKKDKVEFFEGGAENLPFLENGTVDLISAATAAHWFEYPKAWHELARVLKPSGTVAFWGYSDFRIQGYPSTIPIIEEFINGSATPYSLGSYWQQPGRDRLRRLLVTLPPPPAELFTEREFVFYVGNYHPELEGGVDGGAETVVTREPVALSQSLTWEGLESYLRTWSALNSWLEKHPEVAGKKEDDPVGRFIIDLKDALNEEGKDLNEPLIIESPVAVLFYRRR